MQATHFSSIRGGARRVRGVAATASVWLAIVLVLATMIWFAAFAGLLAIARQIHVDIPPMFAAKLPLLRLGPRLIFAGESRTAFMVDPDLAARLLGQPPGYAVNIGFESGEPLAVLGAIDKLPDPFRSSHLVISIGAFHFNDGTRAASLYPVDVAARLPVWRLMTHFLPLRIGTLIRFIRNAFEARLASEQSVAVAAPPPERHGLQLLRGVMRPDQATSDNGHYQNWSLAGPRAHYATQALCDMAKRVTRRCPGDVSPATSGT